MTPPRLLHLLAAQLDGPVAAEGGRLHVCGTPDDTLELLAVSPEGWRAVLQWQGHDPLPDTRGTGKTGRFAIVVQTARGLRADRGADAWRPPEDADPEADAPGANKSTLALATYVAGLARACVFLDEAAEPLPDVLHHRVKGRLQAVGELGGDWLEIDGLSARQYQTNFEVSYAG